MENLMMQLPLLWHQEQQAVGSQTMIVLLKLQEAPLETAALLEGNCLDRLVNIYYMNIYHKYIFAL